jgi:hypothetical protein
MEQLQHELAELKAEVARRALEKQVKALRSKVSPSKLGKIRQGMIFVGKGIVAGARAFDEGLQALEEKTGM